MGRRPCCTKEEGLNRGAWTAHEDKILTDYIKLHGEGKWRNLSKKAGLKRCGKSCRLRWLNYLRPDIKRGNISPDEDELIIRLHKLLGNRWSLIAGRLPGRTDNEIKNYWNTNLGKRVLDEKKNSQKPKKASPPLPPPLKSSHKVEEPNNNDINHSDAAGLMPLIDDGDLLMNFSVEEHCFSDILNCSFSDMGVCRLCNNDDQPLMFSEEMLQHWLGE